MAALRRTRKQNLHPRPSPCQTKPMGRKLGRDDEIGKNERSLRKVGHVEVSRQPSMILERCAGTVLAQVCMFQHPETLLQTTQNLPNPKPLNTPKQLNECCDSMPGETFSAAPESTTAARRSHLLCSADSHPIPRFHHLRHLYH